MASTIKVKRSSTASAVPSSLAEGELAANTTDGKLFLGKADSSVVEIGAGGGGGGSSVTIEALESLKAGDPIEWVKSGAEYKARRFRPGWNIGPMAASSDPAVCGTALDGIWPIMQDIGSYNNPETAYFKCGDYYVLGYASSEVSPNSNSLSWVMYTLRLSDYDGSVLEIVDEIKIAQGRTAPYTYTMGRIVGACPSSSDGYGYIYAHQLTTSAPSYLNIYGFKVDADGKFSIGSPSTTSLSTYDMNSLLNYTTMCSCSDDANNAALFVYNSTSSVHVYTVTMNESTLAVTIQDESTVTTTGFNSKPYNAVKIPGINCVLVRCYAGWLTMKWDSNTDYTPSLQDTEASGSINYGDDEALCVWSSTSVVAMVTGGSSIIELQIDGSGNITAGNTTACGVTTSTSTLAKTDSNTLVQYYYSNSSRGYKKYSYDSGTSAFVLDDTVLDGSIGATNAAYYRARALCISGTNIFSSPLLYDGGSGPSQRDFIRIHAITANDTDGILRQSAYGSTVGQLTHDVTGNGFGIASYLSSTTLYLTAFNSITQEVGSTLTFSIAVKNSSYSSYDVILCGDKAVLFYYDNSDSKLSIATINLNTSTLALSEHGSTVSKVDIASSSFRLISSPGSADGKRGIVVANESTAKVVFYGYYYSDATGEFLLDGNALGNAAFDYTVDGGLVNINESMWYFGNNVSATEHAIIKAGDEYINPTLYVYPNTVNTVDIPRYLAHIPAYNGVQVFTSGSTGTQHGEYTFSDGSSSDFGSGTMYLKEREKFGYYNSSAQPIHIHGLGYINVGGGGYTVTFINGKEYRNNITEYSIGAAYNTYVYDYGDYDSSNNQFGHAYYTRPYIYCGNGSRFIGFASSDVSKGSDVTVNSIGTPTTGLSGFTAGQPVFIDIKRKNITQNNSPSSIRIGHASASDTIYAVTPC